MYYIHSLEGSRAFFHKITLDQGYASTAHVTVSKLCTLLLNTPQTSVVTIINDTLEGIGTAAQYINNLFVKCFFF